MIKINIVTPLSRGENLGYLGESIQKGLTPDVTVKWWVVADPTCSHIDDTIDWKEEFPFIEQIEGEKSALAGHGHRNLILNKIEKNKDEYFYSLDDDNIIHPDFFKVMIDNQVYDGVIGNQLLKGDTLRLQANPNKVVLNNVDTAQFCVRLSILNRLRFLEDRYDADGVFIEQLYRENRHRFIVLNTPFCYYNYLR